MRKHTMRNILAGVGIPMSLSTRAFASSDIASSPIGQGLTRLFQDLSTWLIVLAPIVAGGIAVYFIIRRSMADEQDGKLWEKRIKTAIVCGVAGALVGGIIKLIASYFN